MDFDKALVAWMKLNGKRDEDVAVIVGVSAYTVGTWRKGQARPRHEHSEVCRRSLPGFADLLDGKVVA